MVWKNPYTFAGIKGSARSWEYPVPSLKVGVGAHEHLSNCDPIIFPIKDLVPRRESKYFTRELFEGNF